MIQKLEEELDVKIFSRDRKNISPTAIGEKIIRQARIALNETQRIREVVADESSSMNGSLRIGILPTIAPYLVPDFIYHCHHHASRSAGQHSGDSGICGKVCCLLLGKMQ